jgi:hypothetical protein
MSQPQVLGTLLMASRVCPQGPRDPRSRAVCIAQSDPDAPVRQIGGYVLPATQVALRDLGCAASTRQPWFCAKRPDADAAHSHGGFTVR